MQIDNVSNAHFLQWVKLPFCTQIVPEPLSFCSFLSGKGKDQRIIGEIYTLFELPHTKAKPEDGTVNGGEKV